MTKSIWAGLVALVIVLACGIVEVAVLTNRYEELSVQCDEVIAKAESETLTVEEYATLRENWIDLRETSELLLPHVDVYELNLRFAEAESYCAQGDYKQLRAQLSIISELLQYIPHLMTPSIKHIV